MKKRLLLLFFLVLLETLSIPIYCTEALTLLDISTLPDTLHSNTPVNDIGTDTTPNIVQKIIPDHFIRSKYNIYYSSHSLTNDKCYVDLNNFLNGYEDYYQFPVYPVYPEQWNVKELGFNFRYKDNLFYHTELDYYSRNYTIEHYQIINNDGYFPAYTEHKCDGFMIPKVGMQYYFYERAYSSAFVRGSLGYPIQVIFPGDQLTYNGTAYRYSAFAPDVSVMAGGEMGIESFRFGLSFGYDLIPMRYTSMFKGRKANFGGEMFEFYFLANLDENFLGFQDRSTFEVRDNGLYFGWAKIDHKAYNDEFESINLDVLSQDDSLHEVIHHPSTSGQWDYVSLGLEGKLKHRLSWMIEAGMYTTHLKFKDTYQENGVIHNPSIRSDKYFAMPALGLKYYFLNTSKLDVFGNGILGFPMLTRNKKNDDINHSIKLPILSSKISAGILYGFYWTKFEVEAGYLYLPIRISTAYDTHHINAGDFFIGYKLWVKF